MNRYAVAAGFSLLLTWIMVLPPVWAHADAGAPGETHPFVVSGVVTNKEARQSLTGFIDWLSAASGYPMHLVYARNYMDLSRIMRENPKAVGWTCGAPFVEDHDQDGQQLVSIPLFNRKPIYHSVVLTQMGRPEQRLMDFKGGVLAFSDPRSNSGFVAPAVALKKDGIDIADHFRLMINAGNHEGSLEALVNHLAEVAAVDEYIWASFQRQHPEQARGLVELERFGPFAFTPIVAGSGVTPRVVTALRSALGRMADDPMGQVVLRDFSLDGFVTRNADFYDPIRDALRFLKGPQR